MVIAESFSLGRPVLAADLGNHGSVVRQSRGGVVYEPGNKAAFCTAAEELIANNRVYAENARRYFENCLNEERNYELLSEIYDKAKCIR